MNEHEEKTIDAFIVKEKRRRYKSLLSNSKKRTEALDNLNHLHDLDEKYVIWLKSNAPINLMLRQHESPEQVYVMSDNKGIDGRRMPLDEAIFEAAFSGWGTIISCIPGQLAYYYAEEGIKRGILKRKLNE